METFLKVSTETGAMVAKKLEEINLSDLSIEANPSLVLLGSDRFLQIYFKTNSENIYCIKQLGSNWILENIRDGMVHKFSKTELHYSKISKDEQFFFDKNYQTSQITEIVGVCGKIWTNPANYQESILVQTYKNKKK